MQFPKESEATPAAFCEDLKQQRRWGMPQLRKAAFYPQNLALTRLVKLSLSWPGLKYAMLQKDLILDIPTNVFSAKIVSIQCSIQGLFLIQGFNLSLKC